MSTTAFETNHYQTVDDASQPHDSGWETDQNPERAFTVLDGVLFPLVAANAHVIVRCWWMGGAEVSLSTAMNNYPALMTEENAHMVVADVMQLLADPVVERPQNEQPEFDPQLPELVEPRQPAEEKRAQPESKPLSLLSRVERQVAPKVQPDTMAELPFASLEPKATELKPVNLPPIEKPVAASPESKAGLVEPTEPPLKLVPGISVKLQPERPSAPETLRLTPPTAEATLEPKAKPKPLTAPAFATTETMPEPEILHRSVGVSEPVLSWSLAEAIEADITEPPILQNIVHQPAEYALNQEPESPVPAILDQIDGALVSAEPLLQRAIIDPGRMQIPLPHVQLEPQTIIERTAEGAPELPPDVGQQLLELVGVLDQPEVQAELAANETHDQLDQLLSRILGPAGIDYQPDQIEPVAKLALARRLAEQLSEPGRETARNYLAATAGTHESINKPLPGHNNVQRAVASFVLGRLGVWLFSLSAT